MSVSAVRAASRVPPVPSRNLLRFLRTQTDVAFFTQAYSHASYPSTVGSRGTCSRARPSETSSRRKSTTLTPRRHVLSDKRQLSTTRPVSKISEPYEVKDPHVKSWQERLWGSPAKKGNKPLHPDDLPAHDNCDHNSSMFTSRRTMAAKAALEPRLRCTEVDEIGKVILVDGEFKKTELIAKVCISHLPNLMTLRL